MTTVHSAVPAADLLEAFQHGDVIDLIAESVRRVFQELIEAEVTAQIGADRYERVDERVTHRNGLPGQTVDHTGRRCRGPYPEVAAGVVLPLDRHCMGIRKVMAWVWQRGAVFLGGGGASR